MTSADVTSDMQFDYVVVGAGTAGCLLATRLAENGKARVALLEAGSRDRSLLTRIPLGFGKVVSDPKKTWTLTSEPVEHLLGRRCLALSGKLVGGTSAINGLLQTRGHPDDYDAWVREGCVGWSYADVLPFFERAEDALGINRPNRSETSSTLAQDFLETCETLGYPVHASGTEQYCGAVLPKTTISDGRRISSGARLGKGHRNPVLFTNCIVHRVELADGCATGVIARSGASRLRFQATREVVLCAGALRSPMILFHSGIGDAKVLQEAGIEVRHPLPGVGRNLQDHFGVHLAWTCRDSETLNAILGSPLRLSIAALKWLALRRGVLARPLAEAMLFAARDLSDLPDVEVILRPMDGSAENGLSEMPSISMTTYPLRPESRGFVRPVSPYPEADLMFTPEYLSSSADLDALVKAIGLARKIAGTTPLARRLVREIRPGTAVKDFSALADFVRAEGRSASHYVGTCRMGNGSDAVVDPSLKVRGLSALRVADASIMPRLISGHTNAPTQMIAEKCAAMIHEEAN